jgi:hypothetical protein
MTHIVQNIDGKSNSLKPSLSYPSYKSYPTNTRNPTDLPPTWDVFETDYAELINLVN